MNTLSYNQKLGLGNILEKLAQSIDLTDTQYRDAVDRYESVGRFLSDPSGSLAPYNPRIVPQGSFRIGTVTKPVNEDCEFDVDTTCRLDISLPAVQHFVKNVVGDRFKNDGTYSKMLDEKTRCWRLKYAEASRFHLDIVSAIADNFQWLVELGVPRKYAEHAVRITDINHKDYNSISFDLPKSNPEGYALWFLDVMKLQADQIRLKLATELRLSLDKVPEYRVRTPLQRSVQLMKRHRDIMYKDDDLKPISIIITTLAARAYSDVMSNSNSGLFYDIVVEIVKRMPDYIENRFGVSWVVNPVNPNENFADKWHADNRLSEAFNKWHGAFLNTLQSDKLTKDHVALTDHLRLSFGTKTVNDSLNNQLGLNDQQREDYLRKAASLIGSGNAFTDSHGNIVSQNSQTVKNQPHRFHFGTSIRIPRDKSYKYAYLQYQKRLIEASYKFLKCKVEHNVLKCIGWVQPIGCKQAYKILVEYVVGYEPKTTILEPQIKPSSKIHMYSDRSLCLHYSPDMKWTERTNVCDYTIPWISEWLIFYELYLINGNIWEGKESPTHLTESSINRNIDIN